MEVLSMLLHKLLVQCHISFNYLKVRRSFLTCFKVAHPEQRLQQDEKMLILRYITQEHVKLGAPVISCRLSRFHCRLSRPNCRGREGGADGFEMEQMILLLLTPWLRFSTRTPKLPPVKKKLFLVGKLVSAAD